MAERTNEPHRVLLPRGKALRLLIRVELARREGESPDGKDAALADLIEGFFDEREPPLDIGLDCNGDGVPDFKGDAKAALEAVASGVCDCRAEVRVEAPRAVVQAEPERALPAEKKKGGSREW